MAQLEKSSAQSRRPLRLGGDEWLKSITAETPRTPRDRQRIQKCATSNRLQTSRVNLKKIRGFVENMKSRILLIFALVVALFSTGWIAASQVRPRGWDYKVVLSNTGGGVELNQPGDNGWELVTVVPLANSTQSWLYFKRQK